MSFSKKIQKYFTTLFISIIQEGSSYKLYCRVLKNTKVKKQFDKTFDIKLDDEKLNTEMENYILSLQDKFNYVYISVLLNSMGQGAIKGTNNIEFKKSNIDVNNIKAVKFKNWSVFVSYIDLNWIQKIFDGVGLDLVYSPFVILHELLLNYKLKNRPTLYMLNLENSVTIGVFKEDTLYFGALYNMDKKDILSDSIVVDDWDNEEKVTEEFVSFKDEDKEEFSNLDDLSDLDIKLDEEEFSDIKGEDAKDIELYGRDLEIFKFLSEAIKEYYKNDIFKSDFLEHMIIFNGYEISQEMTDSIKNDLLLEVKIDKVTVDDIIFNLSIRDIYGQL